MTNKPTPTDAEIRELAATGNGVYQDDETAIWEITDPSLLKFARAVLAKWGQPAQAEEPFCWHWENTFNGGMGAVKKNPETLGINMSHPDYKWTALYTAPQPTQAQAGAVPLTNEQIRAMLNKHPPEAVCDWSYRMGIDDAELHHGIKGGQHGTE